MANNDYAIVVGIRRYPLLGDLQGPENDANDFRDWLIDPKGGAVPKDNVHVRMILSPAAPAADALDEEPTVGTVLKEFDRLAILGDDHDGRAGRRLYLYFAGHGFAPNTVEVALLMANAARNRAGYNFGGRAYADWFRTSAYFEEVVLFMDCCRERATTTKVPPVHLDDAPATNPARYAYLFAAEWSSASREQQVNGKVSGLFTMAVLAGLRGEAPRDEAGQLTSVTLKDFIRRKLPALAQQFQLKRQDPQFDVPEKDPIVFSKEPPVRFHVRVALRAPLTGQPVALIDGDRQAVAATKTSATLWEWDLPSGLYKISVAGNPDKWLELPKDPFDVTF